jgi:hypothetical protein
MTAPVLTRRQLNRATLARQLLLGRERVGVVDAVQRLGGLQAQEARPPYLALWSRVEGFARQDLHRALHEREVVRATLMRATLHLLSAGDYAAVRTALAPALTRAMTGVLRARRATVDVEAVASAARELVRERARTFDELRALLSEAFPDADERALGYVVRTQLPLTMVPTDDRWGFPPASHVELLSAALADDGPRALALRYLGAFGPASATDLQAWSGLTGMKAVLDELRGELVAFRDERGRELLDLPDASRPDEDVPAPARLLPEFDSLVLAHDDRTRVIADEHRPLVATKNLRIRATFLWDGFVAGTWSLKGKKVVLEPFAPLPKRATAELAEEGEALARFVADA